MGFGYLCKVKKLALFQIIVLFKLLSGTAHMCVQKTLNYRRSITDAPTLSPLFHWNIGTTEELLKKALDNFHYCTFKAKLAY